ncbi:MAG: RagB/SusD family nutrient uptake outer membrane protein [Chryseolinea sp.]
MRTEFKIDFDKPTSNNSILMNIKHTLLCVAFALGCTAMMTSCNDDVLNTVPRTTIPEEDAYSTSGKIQAQVNNLYGQLQSATFYGGRLIVFNEQRADEFGQNDGNAAAGSAVWNQNVASTSEYINNVWSAGYTAINAANILIDKLKDGNVVSDSLERLYTGEAKFVRALSYFCLVQTYAKSYYLDQDGLGLPLRVNPITGAGFNDMARSSVTEIYGQILQDLNDAETALPSNYSTATLNATRAKKATAVALKTRVYLHKGDYASVIAEARKLVTDAPPFQYTVGNLTQRLEPNLANVFSGSYTGSEAIFTIPFANTTTETPPSQSSLAYNYLGQPIIFLAANGVVANPVFSTTADARSALVSTNSAKQKVLRKFSITTAPFRDYVPVIRYAEILLNYAEAAARTNDLAKATQLLSAVRNRAHPAYVFPDASVSTQDALIETILTERRVEFVGEGFRLGDLQRLGRTIPAKVGAIGTAPQVPPTSSNYIWPIPSGEISTNKLIELNP